MMKTLKTINYRKENEPYIRQVYKKHTPNTFLHIKLSLVKFFYYLSVTTRLVK